MGFFSRLANEVVKNISSASADKFREMAKDPRMPRQKREELLDKVERADIARIKIEAEKWDVIDERDRQSRLKDKIDAIHYETQRLKQHLRSRYDD